VLAWQAAKWQLDIRQRSRNKLPRLEDETTEFVRGFIRGELEERLQPVGEVGRRQAQRTRDRADRRVGHLRGHAADVELQCVEIVGAGPEPDRALASEGLAQLLRPSLWRQFVYVEEQIDVRLEVDVSAASGAGKQGTTHRAELERRRDNAVRDRPYVLGRGVHPGRIVDSNP